MTLTVCDEDHLENYTYTTLTYINNIAIPQTHNSVRVVCDVEHEEDNTEWKLRNP